MYGVLPTYAAHPLAIPTWSWTQRTNQKPIIIPAGTTNGIAIKVDAISASSTVSGWIEGDESAF
jgi:hypothetical protein